jgi:hypothetical protein
MTSQSRNHSKLFSMIVVLGLMLVTCKKEKDDYRTISKQVHGAINLIINPKDTGTSLMSTIIRDSSNFSGIRSSEGNATCNNAYIAVDMYNGFKLYKIESATSYKYKYSIHVIGALRATATDSTHIIVKSSIGEASFDFSNIDSVKPTYFHFDYPGHAPPIDRHITSELVRGFNPLIDDGAKYFFECPVSDQIIYGWTIGTISKPICYAIYH